MTQDEKMSKIQTLRQSTRESILNVLTAEQREKAEQMRFVERLLQPKPGMGLMRIMAKLDLTEQQKTEIKALIESHRKQCEAVRNDTTLSPDAKRTKIQELRQSSLEKIKALLNAEQVKKLEELMQNRPKPGSKLR